MQEKEQHLKDIRRLGEPMLVAVENIETFRSIQRGVDDMDAGNVTPAEEFHARLRAL